MVTDEAPRLADEVGLMAAPSAVFVVTYVVAAVWAGMVLGSDEVGT